MTREIIVTTGARLHFGFLSCKPSSGPDFGGVGLMLDAPGFTIAVRPSTRFAVRGSAAVCRRAAEFARSCVGSMSDDITLPSVEIEVHSEIPQHVGLGSGTQMGLAIAAALSRLGGDARTDATTLAGRVSRGCRSALGIHGFDRGGFLVGRGKCSGELIGGLATRTEFPTNWRMLLVTPADAHGSAGVAEQEAFARLPAMPMTTTDRLSRIVATQLLPAVGEADFTRCGAGLFEFGETVGRYFAPVQGGTYAHRSTAALIDYLRQAGIRGVGQTSWGPTAFALCESVDEAENIAADVQQHPRFAECQFQVSAARNRGADVVLHDVDAG